MDGETITEEFLLSFTTKPIILTLRDTADFRIEALCGELGIRYIHYNIGFAPHRDRDWADVMDEVKMGVDVGQEIVVHCRSGVRPIGSVYLWYKYHLRFQIFLQV